MQDQTKQDNDKTRMQYGDIPFGFFTFFFWTKI